MPAEWIVGLIISLEALVIIHKQQHREGDMADVVDIKGIDKAELLMALYENARPVGMGWLHNRSEKMSREEAAKLIEEMTFPDKWLGRDTIEFDYLYGRPLKIEIGGDEMRCDLYDRDQGRGAARRIVESLRVKA